MAKLTKEEEIDFGFRQVKADQKQHLVNSVFDTVADKYDLMNDVMSLGVHRLWKKAFLNRIYPSQNLKILDLASGSGDIALSILQKLKDKNIENYSITITDVNPQMLKTAKNRMIDNNLSDENISFDVVNAETLPYENNSFDYCTISFGIRNVPDKHKALEEIYRVLKPGGQFLCLEFSNVDNKLLRKLYDIYSFNAIPFFGLVITGRKE